MRKPDHAPHASRHNDWNATHADKEHIAGTGTTYRLLGSTPPPHAMWHLISIKAKRKAEAAAKHRTGTNTSHRHSRNAHVSTPRKPSPFQQHLCVEGVRNAAPSLTRSGPPDCHKERNNAQGVTAGTEEKRVVFQKTRQNTEVCGCILYAPSFQHKNNPRTEFCHRNYSRKVSKSLIMQCLALSYTRVILLCTAGGEILRCT